MKQKRVASSAARAVLTDIAVLLLCMAFFGLMLFSPLAAAEASLSPEEQALTEAYQRGELIRLHILAASDSPADQWLKLQVRDAVLAAFGLALEQAGTKSADEVWRLLQKESSAMERVARRCAESCGFSGSVSAQAGWLTLPEKRYGQVTLPQGQYRGLRIVLGQGAGQNWWCVLFPQLCLALADDQPWTQPSPAQPGDQKDSPVVTWDSKQILTCWLLCPSESSPPEIAADIMDAEQDQR